MRLVTGFLGLALAAAPHAPSSGSSDSAWVELIPDSRADSQPTLVPWTLTVVNQSSLEMLTFRLHAQSKFRIGRHVCAFTPGQPSAAPGLPNHQAQDLIIQCSDAGFEHGFILHSDLCLSPAEPKMGLNFQGHAVVDLFSGVAQDSVVYQLELKCGA